MALPLRCSNVSIGDATYFEIVGQASGQTQSWQRVDQSTEPELSLVFFLSGTWNELHQQGIEEWPERDPDWVTIHWKR